MEYVDVIFYINLSYRTDRRAHIQNELLKLCNESSKIIRIEAFHIKENGALGCAMSHLEAIKKFKENSEWKTCIILEDDFQFINSDISENNSKLREIIIKYPNWDAISLTYLPHTLMFEKIESSNNIVKVLSHQCTAGYMLKKGEILEDLIKCFNRCIFYFKKYNENLKDINIDRAWKKIQCKYNWYTTLPQIGNFIDGYSDIIHKNVVHTNLGVLY